MLPWLLNCLYFVAIGAATPWLCWRAVVRRKPLGGVWRKLCGSVPRRDPTRPCFWLHAVSVGEVLQLPLLISKLGARYPEHEFVVTVTTAAGYKVAAQHLPQCSLGWFPFDFSWAVSRALKTLNPSAVLLVELELWPNFLAAASRQHIPVLVVNGRISEKSLRVYRRLGRAGALLFQRVSCVAAQDHDSAERFHALGVSSHKLCVTGNIKFDRVQCDRDRPEARRLAKAFQLIGDTPVFVAGSTQAGEDEAAIEAWEAGCRIDPTLQLVLVPRHPERFEDVARLIESRGYVAIRRSQPNKQFAPERPIIRLLDTVGELSACWGLADLAFVGGSLTNRGGQNMLEPCGYGAAVCFGPHTFNFREATTALVARQAATVVQNASELAICIEGWLHDPQERQAMGRRAQQFVQQQRGATDRTVAVIEQHVANLAAQMDQPYRRAA